MVGIIFNSFIASLIPISFGYFLNKFFKIKTQIFEYGIYGFLPTKICTIKFFYPLSKIE